MRPGGLGRWTRVLLLAAIVLLVGVGPKAERALSQAAEAPAYAPGHIFVKFREGAPADVEERLEDATGATEKRELSFIDVSIVDLPEELSVPEAVERFESLPYVEYAESDQRVSLDQDAAQTDSYEALSGDVVEPAPEEDAFSDPAPDPVVDAASPEVAPVRPDDTGYPEQWGMDNTAQVVDPDPGDGVAGTGGTPDADVDAPEAWGYTTGGSDTVVAVIDSGVDTSHPDLVDNIWTNPDEVPGNGVDDDGNNKVDDAHGWDFVNGDNTVYDDEGEYYHHGTHLAGTIAAVGNNGTGVAGVSWGAKVMPLKFVAPGGGFTSQAIDALKYAVTEGADISNHSYNFNNSNQAFLDTIRWANEQGHLVVSSAGNNAINTDTTPQYPAGYDSPNVLSVAASDHNDSLWTNSNRGAASVDLAAPGVGIRSTVPDGAYGTKTGTSMAAAYVSGAAALLKSDRPGLLPEQLKDRILLGAEQKAKLSGTSVSGGRLNLADALGLQDADVSLNSNTSALAYGAAPVLSGRLASPGGALAGEQVVVQKRAVGEAGFVSLATVTTGADGSFSYGGSHPTEHTDYRARYGGNREAKVASAVSPAARVNVSASVTLSVQQSNLQLGRARAISGYVRPSHAGGYVTLTIDKRNSAWRIERNLHLSTYSRYSTTFKPGSVGVYDMKTSFPSDADHLGGQSVTKTFKVVR